MSAASVPFLVGDGNVNHRASMIMQIFNCDITAKMTPGQVLGNY